MRNYQTKTNCDRKGETTKPIYGKDRFYHIFEHWLLEDIAHQRRNYSARTLRRN